tara:strand:- start:430 stop:843 length:414 start_codon:yes stop_codon:yes gene_type:complete
MINTLIIVLIALLAICLVIIGFAMWYSIRLSKTLMYFSENMNDLLDSLVEYSNHVQSVYGLESYYGDQVLHNLLKHSQNIVEQIEMFDDILHLAEETEEEGEEMYEQEEQQIEQYNTEEGEQAEETPRSPQSIRLGF